MRNRLLQLLLDNRRPYAPMQARIAAEGDEATIYLYDPIVADRWEAEYFGGVCPQDFVPALHGLKASTVHLRINSPGGDVFAAEAIAQSLREHSATIVAHIEGVAASAATVIACASDEVAITQASKYMIHKTWTVTMGNADDHAAMIEVLNKCDQSLVDEYARRTGLEPRQLMDWCAAETWFTAEEAVAHHFADRIAESPKAGPSAAWNLRAYQHAPVQTPAPEHISDDHRARQQQRLQMRAHRIV